MVRLFLYFSSSVPVDEGVLNLSQPKGASIPVCITFMRLQTECAPSCKLWQMASLLQILFSKRVLRNKLQESLPKMDREISRWWVFWFFRLCSDRSLVCPVVFGFSVFLFFFLFFSGCVRPVPASFFLELASESQIQRPAVRTITRPRQPCLVAVVAMRLLLCLKPQTAQVVSPRSFWALTALKPLLLPPQSNTIIVCVNVQRTSGK